MHELGTGGLRTRATAWWGAALVALALAGCTVPGDGPTDGGSDDAGGQTAEEFCGGLAAYDVEATASADGVELTWGYAAPTRDAVPFDVLRREAGAEGWTTVTTVELTSSDEYRALDAAAPEGDLEYAIAPTQPSCERSPVCPEVPDACATVSAVATEPD